MTLEGRRGAPKAYKSIDMTCNYDPYLPLQADSSRRGSFISDPFPSLSSIKGTSHEHGRTGFMSASCLALLDAASLETDAARHLYPPLKFSSVPCHIIRNQYSQHPVVDRLYSQQGNQNS